MRVILWASLVVFCSAPLFASLIVLVPTQTGISICADRRQVDAKRGIQDNYTKLLQINRWFGFGATGYTRFFDGQTLKSLFDASGVTLNYFASNSIDPIDWNQYSTSLIEGFRGMLSVTAKEYWPGTHNELRNSVFQIVIFSVVNEQPDFKILHFLFEDKGPGLEPNIECKVTTIGSIGLGAFGNLTVWRELTRGSSPLLEKEQNLSLIKKVLMQPEPFNRTIISEDEGLEFGRQMIKITNEKSSLLGGEAFPVGPTYDCVVVDGKTGFRWIK